MMTEDVLGALRTLGCRPEEIPGFGYRFECEGLDVLFPVNDNDTECLTLTAPNVAEIPPEHRTETLEWMMELTRRMKYVQPQIMFDDQVWLNYQHYIGDREVTPELLEHMIRVLMISTFTFHKIRKGEIDED
ncbi:MAG: hypothetical protein K2F87_01245 [Muribaculaceae bacterium]|nr:hypothetical protein [Muribaculaceae bacterium]